MLRFFRRESFKVGSNITADEVLSTFTASGLRVQFRHPRPKCSFALGVAAPPPDVRRWLCPAETSALILRGYAP